MTMMIMSEAKAQCLLCSMVPAEAFGKDEAAKATAKVRELYKGGKVDDATFDELIAWLGNHSAIRQWGVKQGFIASKDAEEDATAKQLKKLIAEQDKELEKMAKK